MTRGLVVLAAFLAAVAPPAGADTVAVVGGRVVTLGPLGILDPGTVLIEDGRIAAVGSALAVPAGARVIDAAGKTVTPGLFDSSTQIGLVEVSAVVGSRDTETADDRITAAFRVVDALNPASTLIPVNRAEGLTRALVFPGAKSSLIAGQAAVIHLGVGPTLGWDPVVRAPAAMMVVLGEDGAGLAGGSRGAAMLRLREALQDARDYDANRAAFERAERREYALSRLDLEALVPVVRGELPLMVNAERASDLLATLALAEEEGVELVIVGAAEGWRIADRLAAAGVPVVVDPLVDLPKRFESLGATLENASRLHAAGVRVAFLSWSSHNARNLRQAAGNAVAHGLPWEAALAAMTTVPAAIWGIEEYGSLTPGMDADLVVWDGDPLEVTTFPDHVFVRGVEMPADTRQTRLRDRYLELPKEGELPPAYPRR